MILQHDLVLDAITNRRPLVELFESAAGELLDGYIIVDYVISGNIPDTMLNGKPTKLPADCFFDDHKHLMSIDADSLLNAFDDEFIEQCREQKHFPHEYIVRLFDTFLVAEISPSSFETEFVVVAPPSQEGGDLFSAMFASSCLTSLLLSISQQPISEMALYVKIDQLLEYLRTGLEKN